MKTCRVLSAILFVALYLIAQGCKGPDGRRTLPVVLSFEVIDPATGHVSDMVRTNGDVSIVYSQHKGKLEAFDAATGLPFYMTTTEVETVVVDDRTEKNTVTVKLGELIPAIVARLFRPGELEQRDLHLVGETPQPAVAVATARRIPKSPLGPVISHEEGKHP